jgi:hypothetical protein
MLSRSVRDLERVQEKRKREERKKVDEKTSSQEYE